MPFWCETSCNTLGGGESSELTATASPIDNENPVLTGEDGHISSGLSARFRNQFGHAVHASPGLGKQRNT
jgi:hypothetical protein